MVKLIRLSIGLVLLLLPLGVVMAQSNDSEADAPVMSYPPRYQLDGFRYEAQGWNNCGPATLTMGLSYFGYQDNQERAAQWLKPNTEDKNVSPWQMLEFVNTQVPELPVYSLKRYGGDLDTLRLLISNDFPVIIELGYDPESAAQGWMGHYLLMTGYDDARQMFVTHDSYDGANLEYSYDHVQNFWQHFNYVYLVLYESAREPELLDLLGSDADLSQNYINAFEIARAEAIADSEDSFAWFNMGSMLVELEMYEDAAIAFDQARNVGDGLPWRMLWYQFGPLEAYNAVGRYEDTIALVSTLRESSSDYVEEAFYYAAVAREMMGETQRAIDNYNAVLAFNPNFHPALERRDALLEQT